MERVCKEKHIRIDEKLDVQERRLNDHSSRLDNIEQTNAKMNERLSGLITQLGTLNSTLRWFMGLFATALLGFFMYAVQQVLIG